MFQIEITDESLHTRKFRIPERGLTIGRSVDCDIVLEDESISRRHARIGQEKGQCYIEDIGSRNGLLVNGSRTRYHWLREGDTVDLPHYRIGFHCTHAPEGGGGKAKMSEEIDRSLKLVQKRREALGRRARPHPYAVIAVVFMFLAALHWAFFASAVFLGLLALREISVKKVRGGHFLALAAIGGGAVIWATSMFISAGGMQIFFERDPLEAQCRENMHVIWAGLQMYRDREGAYPDDLSELFPDYVPSMAKLSCPGSRLPGPGAGYRYAGPRAATGRSGDVLVIDDGADNHRRRGALVLFADGRIERLSWREYEYLSVQQDWMN